MRWPQCARSTGMRLSPLSSVFGSIALYRPPVNSCLCITFRTLSASLFLRFVGSSSVRSVTVGHRISSRPKTSTSSVWHEKSTPQLVTYAAPQAALLLLGYLHASRFSTTIRGVLCSYVEATTHLLASFSSRATRSGFTARPFYFALGVHRRMCLSRKSDASEYVLSPSR